MLFYAKINTPQPQQPPHVSHDKPTRYNISYKRRHIKQNQLLEHKIECMIVNNSCIKRFDNAEENDIGTIFEDIDDLVVVINTITLPLDFEQ